MELSMSSHVLPPPVPKLDQSTERPKLWVIEDEQELSHLDVSEEGSSVETHEIKTRYVNPSALDAAVALCGVPTGDSISRNSFSDKTGEARNNKLLGELFHLKVGRGTGIPSHYGETCSNLVRESNRMNTGQLVAGVRLVRRRRLQNALLGFSAAGSVAVMLVMVTV
jgi:hypothetical protein